MKDGAGSLFDSLRSSIPAPGSGLPRTFATPQLPIIGGTAIVPVNPELEAQRLAVMARRLPSGSAIPLPPIQTSTALVPAGGVQTPPPQMPSPQVLGNPRLEALRRLAQLVNLAEVGPALAMLPVAIADDNTNYGRIKYTGSFGGPSFSTNPYAYTNDRRSSNRVVAKPAEPVKGMSYSDYAEGKRNQFGITALGGTQGRPTKTNAAPKTGPTAQSDKRASGSVNTSRAETSRVTAPQQPVSGRTSTNSQTKTQQSSPASATRPQSTATTKPSNVPGQPQRQRSSPTVLQAQVSSKATATQGTSPRVTQAEKPSATQKSAPVAKAEPSGEALSYFRKNKQSAGWDALGTAVSLVQRSLSPDKGGLKSRAEYDRLLRGSDNFKKLDGDEQQRVRQAFAQWMNEQTIFKGKA